jgi:hypothetical protein
MGQRTFDDAYVIVAAARLPATCPATAGVARTRALGADPTVILRP